MRGAVRVNETQGSRLLRFHLAHRVEWESLPKVACSRDVMSKTWAMRVTSKPGSPQSTNVLEHNQHAISVFSPEWVTPKAAPDPCPSSVSSIWPLHSDAVGPCLLKTRSRSAFVREPTTRATQGLNNSSILALESNHHIKTLSNPKIRPQNLFTVFSAVSIYSSIPSFP
jgi:hypothetical protein